MQVAGAECFLGYCQGSVPSGYDDPVTNAAISRTNTTDFRYGKTSASPEIR
jgi:hypothetical protein